MANGVRITGIKNQKKKAIKEAYVVIGFEVNNPNAFTEDDILFPNQALSFKDWLQSKHGFNYKQWVHHLDVDYGHAFFYVVDDRKGKVVKFFSFGPNGIGKVGWFNCGSPTAAPIKDGYADSRPGTPDYPITETTKLFRILLTQSQFSNLIIETDKERNKILSGKQKYTAWINDTCAETAMHVLTSSGVGPPLGTGWINMPPAWVYAVSPYKWHYNFVMSRYQEVTLKADHLYWRYLMKKVSLGHFVDSDPAAQEWKTI